MSRNVLTLMGLESFLKSNPGKHNQMQWAVAPQAELSEEHRSKDVRFTCGTTACAAGWASLLAGDVLADRGAYDHEDDAGKIFYKVGTIITPRGKEQAIGVRAKKLLGLTDEVAKALFHNRNSNDAVVYALWMLIDGKSDEDVIAYLIRDNPSIKTDPLSDLSW